MTEAVDPVVAAAPSAHVGRVSTATLIMGPPGSGKTSLAETLAVYLWETAKKVLLLYSWDGGAIPTNVQKRMKQNLIRFWRCPTRSGEGLRLDTIYYATKGYWPRQINPTTGETSPTVELVAPMTVKYLVHCGAGHLLATLPTVALVQPTFCAACKQMIPREQLAVKESIVQTKGFEAVGGVFYDGLTSMCNAVLGHMDHARGTGQIGGEKSSFGGVVRSGNTSWGGNNRADVGFAQTRAQEFVDNSRTIQGLVEGPVFTVLTKEATDEGGLSVVGVNLPGNAATDTAASWFGNVFEMGRERDLEGHEHFALYLRPFYDAQNRRHLLKTSASPTGLPNVLIDPAVGQGEPFSVANLGNVFRMLDEDLRRSLLETVEGVPEAPTTYGEAGTFAVAQPAAAASAVSVVLPTVNTPSGQPALIPSQYAPTAVAPLPVVGKPKPKPSLPAAAPPPSTGAVSAGVAPPPGMKPPMRLPEASATKIPSQ